MSLKLSALFACGLLFITSTGFGEEPAMRPQPAPAQPAKEQLADPIQSSRADRTALRAELRSAGIAARAELRIERGEGRVPSTRIERTAVGEGRKLREQKSQLRDDQRQSVRELRRDSRDERRDALRGFIRRTT